MQTIVCSYRMCAPAAAAPRRLVAPTATNFVLLRPYFTPCRMVIGGTQDPRDHSLQDGAPSKPCKRFASSVGTKASVCRSNAHTPRIPEAARTPFVVVLEALPCATTLPLSSADHGN